MGPFNRTVAIALATVILVACEANDPIMVTSAEFGDAWPFHASEATLYCEGPRAIWAEIGGQYYALNPLAPQWVAEQHPDITLNDLDTVWRDNPDRTGAKADLGPVMDRALAICDG